MAGGGMTGPKGGPGYKCGGVGKTGGDIPIPCSGGGIGGGIHGGAPQGGGGPHGVAL